MITKINEFKNKLNESKDWMSTKVPTTIDAIAKSLNGKAEFIEKIKGPWGIGASYTGSKWNLFDDKGNVLLVTIRHMKVPGAPRFNDNEVIVHNPTDSTKGILMRDPYNSEVVAAFNKLIEKYGTGSETSKAEKPFTREQYDQLLKDFRSNGESFSDDQLYDIAGNLLDEHPGLETFMKNVMKVQDFRGRLTDDLYRNMR